MAGDLPHDVRARWDRSIEEAASQGERLLGFGAKRLPDGQSELLPADVERGMVCVGLAGFIDPPRPEAKAAIADCRAAGIAVKMITGDHAATATAIARQLHLADAPQTLTGAALDAVPDAELPERVERTHVFARTSPEHKLRIVQALQSRGRVVAMTGDGVNDAPSLKQADVGVAMGIKGTEAAKEAAEMVLLDDNFASIVHAVHQGRTVYDNIRKVIAWTLPTNGGEVLGVIVAVLFGLTLPMSAAQILWVNLVTSVTLGLALAFEPSEPGVMARPPRAADSPLLSRFMLWRVLLVSALFGSTMLGLFFHAMTRGETLETARTLVVNAVMAMEVAYLFSVRFLGMRSFTLRGAKGTPAVLAAVAALALAQLIFTYLPVMNELFATRPLAFADLLLVGGAGVVLMILLEAEKVFMRRLQWFEELR
jgi:magnesium-transporting ATPase (P-type)